jgi:hypothetical protein
VTTPSRLNSIARRVPPSATTSAHRPSSAAASAEGGATGSVSTHGAVGTGQVQRLAGELHGAAVAESGARRPDR